MKTLLLGSSDISTSLAHKKFNLPESVLVTSATQLGIPQDKNLILIMN